MAEHLLNIKITQAGRTTALYRPVDYETLQLEKVIHPGETLPFDVASLPASLTVFGDPLTVLVLGSLSHPVNTLLEARLLGALQSDNLLFPLAVPTAEQDAAALELTSLEESQRNEIVRILSEAHPGEWRWLTVTETEPRLHSAVLRYRQAKESGARTENAPAWKPIHIKRLSPGFDAAERYTAAEYTFFELPFHFQQYIQEHLAPDERILYATPRPAMRSSKKRSWLEHERLQAGVLILTSQRLIHLSEILPPDNANIRYGYHVTMGALERFTGSSVQASGRDNLLLRTEWSSREGWSTAEWETPAFTRPALEELTRHLQAFRGGDPAACTLQRAAAPEPPRPLPPLRDSSVNDPLNLVPLNERFSSALDSALAPGEEARAWALIPEWFESGKPARVLVITGRRLFTLPDLALDLPLDLVTTLEYSSSILESFFTVNYTENGKSSRAVLPFPYPVERAFHGCLEAARRCMAVVPLSER